MAESVPKRAQSEGSKRSAVVIFYRSIASSNL